MKPTRRRTLAIPVTALLMCAMTLSFAAMPVARYIIMETSTYIFTVGDLLFIVSLTAAVMTMIFTLILLRVKELSTISED